MFELITPPDGDVVTLSEVKADLRIDTTDFDDELSSWIAAAVTRVQEAARIQLLTATWTLYLDRFPRSTIPIWKAPVTSIETIQYIDQAGNLQALDAADYLVSVRDWPRRITPAYGHSWPVTRRQPDAVRITFVAGYGIASAVPDLAKGLVKLLVRGSWGGCDMDVEPLLNQLRWSNQHENACDDS